MEPHEREHRDDWYEGVADHLALLQVSEAIDGDTEDIAWNLRWSVLYGPAPADGERYQGLTPREAATALVFEAYSYKATGQSGIAG